MKYRILPGVFGRVSFSTEEFVSIDTESGRVDLQREDIQGEVPAKGEFVLLVEEDKEPSRK